MHAKIIAWGKRPFRFTLYACMQFLLFTSLAMLTYPGGTHSDPSTEGYSFFHNYFSSLGLIVARKDEPNTVSAILFFVSLSCAGLGLVVFFVAVLQFFWKTLALRLLGLGGSLFGIISGISFTGIAFTPADILPDLHLEFVLLAFRTFLIVVIFYALAIYMNKEYPNRYAAFYLVFAVMLAGYIYLMTQGPGIETAQGEMIQVTGQKVIVYAAIIIMGIQSIGAMKMVPARQSTTSAPISQQPGSASHPTY